MEPSSVILSVVLVVFTALIVYLNYKRTFRKGKRNKANSASDCTTSGQRLHHQSNSNFKGDNKNDDDNDGDYHSDILKTAAIDPVSHAVVEHDTLPYFPSHETFCSKTVLIIKAEPDNVGNNHADTKYGDEREIKQNGLGEDNLKNNLKTSASQTKPSMKSKNSNKLRIIAADEIREGNRGLSSSEMNDSNLVNEENGAEPVIPISVTEVATEKRSISGDDEPFSQNGGSTPASEAGNGYDLFSLLSPRKDKDDDETSSVGYPEIDIDPEDANIKFPVLLVEKMMEEQFASLRAMKKGNDVLREHRILFLIGDPGSGKTASAASILKTNKGTEINDKVCVYKIYQGFRQFEPDDNSGNFEIVLFDDCFSGVQFDNSSHMDDVEAFLGYIMRARMKCEDVAFVFTIETNVWNTLLAKFHRILSHLTYAIIDLSDGYLALNSEEREGILRWQISKTKATTVQFFKDENLHPAEGHRITISEKTISTILRTDCKDDVGFPELCVLMCMNMNRVRGIHDIGVFRFPRSFIFSHLEGMSKSINNDERMGICILLYAAAKNGCFDKYNINIDLMDMITERVVKDRLDLRSGMRALKNGMLVRLSRSKYIIQHKILQDVLSEYIEQNGILS